MAKKDEKQLPMDIPTLQSMVRKRDSIIASFQGTQTSSLDNEYEAIQVKYQGLVLIHEGMMTDYESCCEQLKARDGEIKQSAETYVQLLKDYGELKKLYDENVKQLDQESDSNASLEDQLKLNTMMRHGDSLTAFLMSKKARFKGCRMNSILVFVR